MQKPEKNSFWALIVTQFFGAFNDNVLKVLVALLVVEWVDDPALQNQLVTLSGAVFVAPFLIFSMIAGRISDRIGKPRVMVATKFWELLVISVAILSLWMKSIPMMMGALFLLSMQATFFSPAKYGVLPELMGEEELSEANGLLNMATFTAILAGTITGSFLATRLSGAYVVMGVASVMGLVASFFVEPLPASKPEEPLAWNPIQDLIENWKIIREDRSLRLGIIAVNYFWLMGAILQLNIFLYAKQMMDATPKVSGYLLMAVALGIGFGSYLAGKLSEGKVELGLVPLGALGMSLFGIDLYFSHHSLVRTLGDLFMMGLSAGFYDIPLTALVQWRSPDAERGRVLATTNFLSFVAILAASGVLWLLGTYFELDPAQVFLTMGLLSLGATAAIYIFLPDAVLRFILYVITNTVYRIRIVGGENIPLKGPALLVCNHLSLADGFLVGGAVPRLIRYLIWRPYYEAMPFRWLVRTMKCIPISETDPPKEIMRSLLTARDALKQGHAVCIFAEGQISRTGNLLEFKRGFEAVVKGLDVPVFPVHLDRVWGSIFSYEHGQVIWKKPRQIPYPVTITFGKPLKPSVQSPEVRQAVLDLGAQAFTYRLDQMKPLPQQFLLRAKKHPSALAVADSFGKELSYGQLAAVSKVLGEALISPPPHPDLPPPGGKGLLDGDCIGILLPPSAAGVVANLAVSLRGRVPVNLNYTAGQQTIDQAVQQANITRIITSRRLLEKIKMTPTANMVYIEDLITGLPRWKIVWERILFSLMPVRWTIKRFAHFQTPSPLVGEGARRADEGAPIEETSPHPHPLPQGERGFDKRGKEYGGEGGLSATATIMFSSGSTGIPKGIVLSHANILSNILGLSQVFDVGKSDRMLGVLPFFHSFGFTGTLWFPLLNGFAAVYHSNPLDAKTIGELADKYSATMLLATPTFLLAYTRKCSPEQFRHLRYVITGAERLRESIARAFEEKFGKTPLEGYGCTELSPVATVNVPDVSMGEIKQVGHKPGKIGHPIPGVSVRIVHPDTLEPLPQGERGLLLVKGTNVMQGYLNAPEKTQEVIREGWYITGDMAMVDPDGFVQIVDRLSRFSKIGGEMVPHVLIEEKLHALTDRADPTFVVTSIPDEKKGEQLVVLYVKERPPSPLMVEGGGEGGSQIDLDDLWKKLQNSDLPKLWIPAKENFFEVSSIPYLAAGKLDLMSLRSVALEKMER